MTDNERQLLIALAVWAKEFLHPTSLHRSTISLWLEEVEDERNEAQADESA